MFFEVVSFIGDIMNYLFALMSHPRITEALGISLPIALFSLWFCGTLVYVFCMRPATGLSAALIQNANREKEPEARQLVTRRTRSGSKGHETVHTVTSDARSGLVLEERWLFND